jgi:protein-S-isoprenylcysteine O-methyltransferase
MSTLDPALWAAIQKHRRIFVDIAIIAFVLGVVAASALIGLVGAGVGWWLWHPTAVAFALYVITCMVGFHMSEFLVAALYRPHDTHPRAFMIYHSPAYMIATAAAIVEFMVETWLIPLDWKLMTVSVPLAIAAALAVTVFYGVRVIAMVQCGSNFSLEIETTHRQDHTLVTSGVFARFRHPSYFGWFWRTVLSQVLLMNPVCLVGFTYVTWKFFVRRIEEEEDILKSKEFFGEKYETYKKSVGTGIPFIA